MLQKLYISLSLSVSLSLSHYICRRFPNTCRGLFCHKSCKVGDVDRNTGCVHYYAYKFQGYQNMPRTSKFLFCSKHLEGPLDVWYDCEECCQGSKEEALKHVRRMSRKEIKGLTDRIGGATRDEITLFSKSITLF